MTATVYDTPDEALEGIADGARIMFGGFVSAGTPSNLIRALKRRGTRDLTIMANNIGFGDPARRAVRGAAGLEGDRDLRGARLQRPGEQLRGAVPPRRGRAGAGAAGHVRGAHPRGGAGIGGS